MKLAPGSDSIEFDSVTLTFNTKNSTQTLVYLNAAYGNTSHFGVEYLQQGTNYQSGVMVRGSLRPRRSSASRRRPS